MPNQIVLLAPDRLRAIIEHETQAGRRAELAEALLRLLQLHATYTAPHEPDTGHERVGTILPCIARAGSNRPEHEFAWHIERDPRPNGHGGVRGDHILNGGLIQHADLKWGLHT